MHPLRFALRGLRRTPAFTLVALLTLALGIGATSAILTLVNAVLVEALPYPEQQRMVWLQGVNTKDGGEEEWPLGYQDVQSLAERRGLFARISPVTGARPFNLVTDGVVEHVSGEMVGAGFFDVFGVGAQRGRLFREEETVPASAARVVVLADALWRTRFGADPGIVGRTIRLNDEPYEVIGVAAGGFAGANDEAQLWLPIGVAGALYGPHYTEMRQFRWLSGVARLAPGVAVERAQAEVDAVQRTLEREFPTENADIGVRLQPLPEAYFGGWRRPLLSLLGAAGFVLLIACVNVANLQLARGAARRREYAVRVALGARAGALARQQLLESLLLVAGGAVVGLVLATVALRLLVASGLVSLASFVSLGLDGRVVVATLLVSLVCAGLFGLAPALSAARTAPVLGLGDGGRGGTAVRGRGRLQRALVTAEVALAMTLVVGAGLMSKGFSRFVGTDLGFAADGLLTMTTDLTGPRWTENPPVFALARDGVARVAAVPGVRGVAVEGPGIVTGGWFAAHFTRDDDTAAEPAQHMTRRHHVTPGWFSTMGVRLLAGRDFGDADVADAPRAMIVSRSFAESVWPGQSPIGRRLRSIGPNPNVWTVVGVAGDVEHGGLQADGAEATDVYLSLYQSPPRSPARLNWIVRTAGDPIAHAATVQAALKEVAPEVPAYGVQSMTDRLRDQTQSARLLVLLMTSFGALALLLAAVGTYGVIAYGVSQRTRELGVRAALGARGDQLVWYVVRLGVRPAVVGVLLGLAGTWALTRLVAGLLYGVSPTDPATLAGTAALMLGVAVAASALPAMRAARADPQAALRAE